MFQLHQASVSREAGVCNRHGLQAPTAIAVILMLATRAAVGTSVAYECNTLPENTGWQVVQIYCNPTLEVLDGWFQQHVDLCPPNPPPGGQQAAFRRTIDEFIGEPTFFLQWRVVTDADRSELPWGGGAAISAGSNGDTNYAFSIASDRAELNRDNLLPIIAVDVQAGVPHTYRLELVGAASYAWYIDGQLVGSGVPEGEYPSFNPRIVWRDKAAFLPNTAKWDYIRYGTIPQPASGDFDSSGTVDANDVYFFLDCLLGPDSAGPGCRWADMNGDLTVNGDDVQLFAAALLGA